jgi:hypothetical protein
MDESPAEAAVLALADAVGRLRPARLRMNVNFNININIKQSLRFLDSLPKLNPGLSQGTG